MMKKTLLETTGFSNTYNCYVLVAYRHELNAKKPVKATVMGLDVIVVQNAKGEISVLDGYCPHMGAPLAGGKIVDDCIVCPFHSWTFNTDGQRVNEQGEPLKKQARTIQKYPVKVVGEYIFAWFDEHQATAKPFIEIPDLEYSDFHQAAMRPYAFANVSLACAVQIPYENTADATHFETVHHNLYAPRQKPGDYGYDPVDKIWFSNVYVEGYTFLEKIGIKFTFPHHVKMWGPNNACDDLPFTYSANEKLKRFLPKRWKELSFTIPVRVTILGVPTDSENSLFRMALCFKDHKQSQYPRLKFLLNKLMAKMIMPLARWEFENEGRTIFETKVNFPNVDHLPSYEREPMKMFLKYCSEFSRGKNKEHENILRKAS
ncbi:MAG: Rieske (2Fe-2S) protein [Pseudomonadales bacterium]|nr:Rieske (2Fe-2S) protein [Pseudomonadales bacterium]